MKTVPLFLLLMAALSCRKPTDSEPQQTDSELPQTGTVRALIRMTALYECPWVAFVGSSPYAVSAATQNMILSFHSANPVALRDSLTIRYRLTGHKPKCEFPDRPSVREIDLVEVSK